MYFDIYNLFQATLFIPILMGFLLRKKLSLPLKIVYYYLWICVVTETTAQLSEYFFRVNSIVYNLFVVVQFGVLSFLYYQIIDINNFKKLLKIISIASICFIIIDVLFSSKSYQLADKAMIFSSIFFSVLSLIHLFTLLKKIGSVNLKTQPLFWITISLLLYFASTQAIHLGLHYLPSSDIKKIWPITWIVILIRNLLITFGFYLCGKQ